MIFSYDATTKVLHKYLSKLDVKSTKFGVKSIIETHPNYPSLLAITDTLNQYSVETHSFNVKIEDTKLIPTPFLSFISSKGGQFVLVNEISKTDVIYYNGDHRVKTTMAQFEELWNNTVVLGTPLKSSRESNFKENYRRQIIDNVKILATVSIIVILTIISGQANLSNNPISIKILFYFLSLTKIVGLFATTFLLAYEVDKANPTLAKICSSIKNSNCGAILNGKYSKVFGLISWSEIGFVYFSFTFLILICNTSLSFPLLFLFSIIVAPYSVFSIYYQWKVAKQWCTLCLIVQVVLIGELIILFLFSSVPILGLVSWELIAVNLNHYTLIAMAFPLLWFLLKSYFLKADRNTRELKELKRIKYTPVVFDSLSGSVKSNFSIDSNLGVILGNPEGSVRITVVCSLYCGPCSRTHNKLGYMIEQMPELRVQIVFTASTNPNDSSFLPTRHLLAIASGDGINDVGMAFSDWYFDTKRNYIDFAAKYPVAESKLVEQNINVDRMFKWCNNSAIRYTPTIIFNNSILPEVYDLNDLEYFLKERVSLG